MASVEAAAEEALKMQRWDDEHAESVAFIFIEDAMRIEGLPTDWFSEVEAIVDRRWKPKRRAGA